MSNFGLAFDYVLMALAPSLAWLFLGRVISGIPAFDNREWLRSTAAFRRLGDMQRALRTLEARLAALEKGSVNP